MREKENTHLKTLISKIHESSRGSYGSPRIHAELQAQGIRCGRRRIARLMREQGLVGRSRTVYRQNRSRRDLYGLLPNRLLGQSLPSSSNQHWVSDTTCFKVKGEWLHLGVVLDRYSRRILGWSVGKSRDAELSCAAMRMALSWRRPVNKVIFHSDQGIEYASASFRSLLDEAGIIQSMSRTGNPYDNAHMESFFKSLKAEVVHGYHFSSKAEAVAHLVDYFSFYNYERRHSSLGYLSPVRFEQTMG